jgi:hypothetical protein
LGAATAMSNTPGPVARTTMIHDTLSKIEARIEKTEAIKADSKVELLGLITTLKTEIDQLSQSNQDQAQTIAGFAQVSAHEATREEKNPQLLKLSLDGLSASVEGFEQSHPKLVDIVNRICTTLSSLGV